MPSCARREIVREGMVGVYHCIHRCVRRAFLCGKDAYTGRSYEHRKEWIRERLIELAGIFAVDICGFSVLCNHLHVIVRIRPDIANTWSAYELARRWWRLYPRRRDEHGLPAEPTREELDALIEERGGEAATEQLFRKRLSSLSWFMARLAEPIARRANREDNCTGRFWSGRFKSQALLDEKAMLACAVYVDLNPIRAELATTPESSEFTSVKERIEAFQARKKIEALEQGFSNEQDLLTKIRESAEDVVVRECERDHWLCPIGEEAGYLPSMNDEAYFQLVDWTGRQLVLGKRGSISDQELPILERLGLEIDRWVKTIECYGRWFRRAVGAAEAMAEEAIRVGRRWLRGVGFARWAFSSSS